MGSRDPSSNTQPSIPCKGAAGCISAISGIIRHEQHATNLEDTADMAGTDVGRLPATHNCYDREE